MSLIIDVFENAVLDLMIIISLICIFYILYNLGLAVIYALCNESPNEKLRDIANKIGMMHSERD